MLNPFVNLLATVIQLYMFCIIAWAILSTLISFRIVNRQQQLVSTVMYTLNRLCSPVLWRIRKVLPNLGGIDLSPVVVLLLLAFAKDALYTYFYNL